MRFRTIKTKPLSTLLIAILLCAAAAAQQTGVSPSQEMSDEEGVPVLMKHLPDWESKRDSALYFIDESRFSAFFKDRRIIDKIEFIPGTEAVFAKYREGELLIVEYTTPQASSATDKDVLGAAGESEDSYVYRRIGNYNVFVFDPSDEAAAAGLLDQIKYQKVVTWPYGNPKPFFAREREFIVGTTSLFISTVLFILAFLGSAILLGAVSGVLYFRARDTRRAAMGVYSDAGGLTRLNIDGLTSELAAEKLLKD